jgi:hypothetical protein
VRAATGSDKDPWNTAIRMEASIALGEWTESERQADVFVADGKVDAFELASALRQLQEVWELAGDVGPGGAVLRALRAGLARKVGGEVAVSKGEIGAALQANFDRESDRGLRWWNTALARCASIGRIETEGGAKIGTGFVVNPHELFSRPVSGPLLLTNAHVISERGAVPGSLRPEDAHVSFEALGRRVAVRDIVACHVELDACLVRLKGEEHGWTPCRLWDDAPVVFDDQQRRRVYVIGYPGGRDLSFSIHDSIWLDYEDPVLHYRTPTEHGNSGSPVFDDQDWKVLALHRAGGTGVPRLRGRKGTYQANVGVSVTAIRQALAAMLSVTQPHGASDRPTGSTSTANPSQPEQVGP